MEKLKALGFGMRLIASMYAPCMLTSIIEAISQEIGPLGECG